MSYFDYIRSDSWQRVRKEAMRKAKFRCQVCGTRTEKLCAHHNNYSNLGRERPEDLIILCSSCHQLFHDRLALAETKTKEALYA